MREILRLELAFDAQNERRALPHVAQLQRIKPQMGSGKKQGAIADHAASRIRYK